MVHHSGGPPRILPCFQNGDMLFVEWPLNGLLALDKKGYFKHTQSKQWRVHAEDWARVTGLDLYHVK